VTVKVELHGFKEAAAKLRALPRAIGLRHKRIALNAAAGVIRDAAKVLANKETGLLGKSLSVKVKVPEASRNAKHHGKPAYAVIGASRKMIRPVNRTAKGKLKAVGAARARKLNITTVRKPSRYLHLVEKGHKTPGGGFVRGSGFMAKAARRAGPLAARKGIQKIQQGIAAEASRRSK